MSNALESLPDPLLTPMLALLQAGINSDLSAQMVDLGETAEDAVTATAPNPVTLEMLGHATLPMLSCFRVRSRSRRFSVAYWEHTYTLRFDYVTPATVLEQIDNRWPLLDIVWRSLISTLSRGSHSAYEDGDPVLEDVGVTKVNTDSAQKLEMYADGGEYAYPMFRAEVDVVCQSDRSTLDIAALYPALSFKHQFFLGDATQEPDVVSISCTPAGVEERDAEPFEEEAELP